MNEPEERISDPALTRIYRQAGGGEPSATLDAAILAAAAKGVAAKPVRRTRWWQRLAAPVALAATVVMAVMLSMTVERQPQEPEARPPRDVPAEQAPAPVESRELQTARSAAKAERAPKPQGRVETRKAAPEISRPSLPEAPASISAAVGAPPPAAAPAPSSAAPAPSQREAATADRSNDAAPASSADPRLERRNMAPAAAASRPAAPAKQAIQPAEAWIEEIRALRRAGKHEEAARRLGEFRAAYPAYLLPDDLR